MKCKLCEREIEGRQCIYPTPRGKYDLVLCQTCYDIQTHIDKQGEENTASNKA